MRFYASAALCCSRAFRFRSLGKAIETSAL